MEKIDGRVVALLIGSALVIFLVNVMIPLGLADSVRHFVVVITAVRHPDNRFTILMATCCSALTVFGFFFSSPEGGLWKVFFNRSITISFVFRSFYTEN